MSGHKAKRHARQNPPPEVRIASAPAVVMPAALEPAKTCDCCCRDCEEIAWIHDDCDPYCDCEEEAG